MKTALTFVLLTLCLSVSTGGFAQDLENNRERENIFIRRVKEIDEFFERYNNDKESFIRNVYKERGKAYTPDRQALIKSMFNYVGNSWRVAQLDSFVRQALAIEMPSKRSFYGRDWYAEAFCRFRYNGSTVEFPLVLQVKEDKKGFKWVIVSVRQSIINGNATTLEGNYSINEKFISPVSHATYFVELGSAFNEKKYLLSYFDPTILHKSQTISFINALQKDQIIFLNVREIRYHFLQVNNYVFTVENFQRDHINSGWLINRLMPASALEKENFRHKLLGE